MHLGFEENFLEVRDMYKSKEVTLGSFEVWSNEIYISDPCYEYDENDNSCVLTLKDVVNGKYIATMKVVRIYHDIESLTIKHEDYLHSEPSIFAGKIGVDSGQAGFFDKEYYAENQGGDFDDLTTLYGLACSLVLSKQEGGIVYNRGAVSSSGCGDREYEVFVGINDIGEIVSASIIFIEEEK